MNGSAATGLLLLTLAGLGALFLVRGYFQPFAQGLADAVSGTGTKQPFDLSGAAASSRPTFTIPGRAQAEVGSSVAAAVAAISSRVQTIEGH